MDKIIAVDEGDPAFFGIAVSHGIGYACVSGCRKTAVFLVDDGNVFVFRSVAVADGGTVVGGTVVNQYQFEILVGLIQDTVDTAFQIRFDFVNRNDYINFLMFH